MTEERDPHKATWLPNLVGGVSIWKLARDLNESKFFDGRLLVPETEGSDSLPVSVRWNLSGLLPLREARATNATDAAQAVNEFVACLKNVSAEFADPASGYNKYKQAFTIPALDEAADNYFFDASTKKLFVINWGASPRTIGGKEEFVFGYGSFEKLIAGAAAAGTAAAIVGAATTAAPQPAAPTAPEAAQKDAKKEDEKKKDKKPGLLIWGRPWWVWLLAVLAAIAILILVLFLLRSCDELHPANDAGVEAGADGAAADAASDANAADGAAAEADAGTDASNDESADAGGKDGGDKDGGSDAGQDGGKDGGADAGKDAGKDGGKDDDGSGSGSGSGSGKLKPGGGAVGGKILLVPGGAGVAVEDLPHRAHFHPEAVHWKVMSGHQYLAAGSPLSGDGQNFDVYLKPGNTFEQVTVLWQDRNGTWHQ